jgi:6-phosphogluconolactonase
MRMKLNKTRHLVLAAAVSLMAATLVTACSQFTQTLTVDFVFVACSKAAASSSAGEIDVFEINSESGRMRQIPSSPFPSGGRNPVAEAVSSDNGSLFVANQDDQNIVQFLVGSDGKLYPYYTVNTPGIFPLALAASKSNLFVVTLFQPLPLCSTAQPCSGSISAYPLAAGTGSNSVTMGAPATNSGNGTQYWPLTLAGANASHVIVPTAVNVAASGSYVYVTAYDSSVTPSVGYVFAFAVGSGGVLTAVSGSPFAAGTQLSAIASDASSNYLYVTDKANADVLGFTIASSGALAPLTTGAGGGNSFAAGNEPVGVAVDPAYPYVYAVNSLDSNLTAYSMSNGTLTYVGTYTTGLQPVAIGIDPSTARFLFTANFLGNNVSGFELNKTNGTLLDSQYSPYGSNAQPTAVAAIPHNGTGGGVQQ